MLVTYTFTRFGKGLARYARAMARVTRDEAIEEIRKEACMSEETMDEILDFDEEFDPLAVDDLDINQEDMDDDNPLDTVDYPTMRNMPEDMRRESLYTPERQGGAQEAIKSLIDHNPGRRGVLLGIIQMCSVEGGLPASQVTEGVNKLQADNLSVYSPMTLCRMLERAGGLTLEMPEVHDAEEDIDEGVEYLEIKEHIDPIWHATEDGKAVVEEFSHAPVFHDIVLDRDSKYLEVYRALMLALDEHPMSKVEIDDLVDTFEIVKKPRRFGGHFVDMLERADAIVWKDRAWHLTDMGRELLPLTAPEGKE